MWRLSRTTNSKLSLMTFLNLSQIQVLKLHRGEGDFVHKKDQKRTVMETNYTGLTIGQPKTMFIIDVRQEKKNLLRLHHNCLHIHGLRTRVEIHVLRHSKHDALCPSEYTYSISSVAWWMVIIHQIVHFC